MRRRKGSRRTFRGRPRRRLVSRRRGRSGRRRSARMRGLRAGRIGYRL